MKESYLLTKNKKDCTGCSGCFNICPVNAIKMKEDENGFLIPVIENDKCINCNKCLVSCPVGRVIKNTPIQSFGAVNLNENIYKNSSSGGIFSVVAEYIIRKKGFVCGVVIDKNFDIFHKLTNNINDIEAMRGSKYAQSNIRNNYSEIKELLLKGIEVLFVGTPCQVAGLKSYLKIDYENLLTIDLICHGVPSNRIFKEYIYTIQKNENNNILEYKFRKKQLGKSIMNEYIRFENEKEIFRPIIRSSYLYAFMKGEIYRDSCYECEYAEIKRVSDITLGDFWGVENYYDLEYKDGVSAVLINTEKGRRILDCIDNDILLFESNIESIRANNEQLKAPCKPSQKREDIYKELNSNGYKSVEDKYLNNLSRRKKIIQSYIPYKFRNFIKQILRGEKK